MTPLKQTDYPANYVSNSFEGNYLSIYKLILSANEFSIDYALVNQLHEVMLLRLNPNEQKLPLNEFLDKICFSDELLKNRFESIEVVVHSPRWTLVPLEFFPNGYEYNYLSIFCDTDPEQDAYYRDLVRPVGLNTVYCMDKDFHSKCDFYFKKCTFRHCITQHLLHSQKLHQKLGSRYTANVELYEKTLTYSVFREKVLLFCNRFQANFPEDFLYYVLATNQSLGIREREIVMMLTGKSSFKDSVEKLLKQQFPRFENARQHFPRQSSFNSANFFHDEFSYFLFKP